MAQYGSPDYWEERYKTDTGTFDWYQQWEGVKDVIQKSGLLVNDKILILGCGTSRLSADMFNDGYKNICSIDISPTCINLMKTKYKSTIPALIYKEMDVKNMHEFQNGEFDVVIDKGTMDSLLCGSNSAENVQEALAEVYRVLNGRGMYICISYGEPANRLLHMKTEGLPWTVATETVKKPDLGEAVPHFGELGGVHYIYICKKPARSL